MVTTISGSTDDFTSIFMEMEVQIHSFTSCEFSLKVRQAFNCLVLLTMMMMKDVVTTGSLLLADKERESPKQRCGRSSSKKGRVWVQRV